MEDFSSSGWLSPSVVLHRWKPANGPSLKRRSLVLWIIFGILAWCSAVNCWLQLFWRPWHNYLCIYKYQYYVKSGYYDIIYFICIITQYVYIYIYIYLFRSCFQRFSTLWVPHGAVLFGLLLLPSCFSPAWENSSHLGGVWMGLVIYGDLENLRIPNFATWLWTWKCFETFPQFLIAILSRENPWIPWLTLTDAMGCLKKHVVEEQNLDGYWWVALSVYPCLSPI